MSFLTICLNPTVQKTLTFTSLSQGEVNRAVRSRTDASGKGVNVSRVLAQLGATVTHLTHAGGTNRDWFLDSCRHGGFNVVAPDSASNMRTCITLLDREAGSTTELIEPTDPVSLGTDAAIRAAFESLLPEAHTVILSGSIPPGYSPDLFPHFARRSKEADRRVVADFRGKALLDSLPFRPDVIKPNLQEFVATFLDVVEFSVPEESDDPAILERVSRRMVELAKGGTIPVITRGGEASMHVSGGSVRYTPVEPVEVVNTIGCGDAFTAGFVLELVKGATIERAVARGHWCAARNAELERPGSIVA